MNVQDEETKIKTEAVSLWTRFLAWLGSEKAKIKVEAAKLRAKM